MMGNQKTKSELPFYVYTWAYPDGTVFYVGMGCDGRVYSMNGRSPLVVQICKNVERMGHSVQRVIVARFKVRQHAHVYEKMLIETYGIEQLANIRSEEGPTTAKLVKPYEASTIIIQRRRPDKTIDVLTLERMTVQPWEDEGAVI